jgi:hypothetical protein
MTLTHQITQITVAGRILDVNRGTLAAMGRVNIKRINIAYHCIGKTRIQKRQLERFADIFCEARDEGYRMNPEHKSQLLGYFQTQQRAIQRQLSYVSKMRRDLINLSATYQDLAVVTRSEPFDDLAKVISTIEDTLAGEVPTLKEQEKANEVYRTEINLL